MNLSIILAFAAGLIIGGTVIWLFKRQMKSKAHATIDQLVSSGKMSVEVAKILKSILGIST